MSMRAWVACAWLLTAAEQIQGQAVPVVPPLPVTEPAHAPILAVVDSAFATINAGTFEKLSDLMVSEGRVFRVRVADGIAQYTTRTTAEQRAIGPLPAIVERGFAPEVRIAGPIAMVWLPYDLYADGKWSHCGVDIFTLVRSGNAWRIANLTYSVEQPPQCRVHPSGPPAGLKVP